MTKRIFGMYASEEEAIKVVNVLELQGHKAKDITIFTNHSKKNDLQKRTDVNVQSVLSDNNKRKEDSSLIQKVKKTIKKNEDTKPHTPYEMLLSFDIPEEQANKCLAYVHSGKVLVVVDDEMRMGHPSYNSAHENDNGIVN